jgi:DNA methylase
MRALQRKVNSADSIGDAFFDDLLAFRAFGRHTQTFVDGGIAYFVNEYWTARQRQSHALHEVSYRACFKAELPRFFITRLTGPGDLVYDPFMGRGTTLLEAALLGRRVAGNDVNPLSRLLIRPRLAPPPLDAVARRLAAIDWRAGAADEERDLLVFFHPETLAEIVALRRHFLECEAAGRLDAVDDWIRMVALGRLTGHSAGFFSVYTLPPNQAVGLAAQRKINAERGQAPPRRDVPALILKKSRSLLRDGASVHLPLERGGRPQRVRPSAGPMTGSGPGAGDAGSDHGGSGVTPPCLPRRRPSPSRGGWAAPHGSVSSLMTGPAWATPDLPDASVTLIVTSPPFLDVVDYQGDNWLRCWFAGIDADGVAIDRHKTVAEWGRFVRRCFHEFVRVVRPGGHIAFEVGEVRGGTVLLERSVVAAVQGLPLTPLGVMVNDQAFTKTAHCWGVGNNRRGTNTNRIVVFRRD